MQIKVTYQDKITQITPVEIEYNWTFRNLSAVK